MQIKHITVAVVAALGFTAAHATPGVSTLVGAAEVYFAARDVAQTYSFLYNTGASFNALADGSINFSGSLAADANWQKFLTDVGGIGNVQWTVGGVQTGTATTKQWFSTIGSGALKAVMPAGSNGSFGTGVNTLGNYLSNDSDIEAAAGTGPYLTVASANSYGITSTLVNVGTTANFFGLQASSTSGAGKLNVLTTPAKATFTANGNLTVIGNVPEPETYGLALVGLLVAGAVVRRRAAK